MYSVCILYYPINFSLQTEVFILPQSTNNHFNFIYFNRVVKLWNALPEMDIELSILSLKKSLKNFFWCHFVCNFNPDSPCYLALSLSLLYITCFSLPSPINFWSFIGCRKFFPVCLQHSLITIPFMLLILC